jgi:hypothetical protein
VEKECAIEDVTDILFNLLSTELESRLVYLTGASNPYFFGILFMTSVF